MSKATVFVAMCSVVLLFSGCDMFRKMAGRPTSKDIEAKREALRLKAEEKKDSTSSETVLAESSMIADSLIGRRQLSEEAMETLEYRYYIIIGAFSKKDNAVRLSAKAETAGYKPTLIAYKNGFTAVGICPSDVLSQAYAALLEVRGGELSPEAWILENGNKNK